jgi:hypothetical protein
VKEINRSIEATSSVTGSIAVDIATVVEATAEAARFSSVVTTCATDIEARASEMRKHFERLTGLPSTNAALDLPERLAA